MDYLKEFDEYDQRDRLPLPESTVAVDATMLAVLAGVILGVVALWRLRHNRTARSAA